MNKKLHSLFAPSPLSDAEAATLIYRKIINPEPCMIARIGAVESKAILYSIFPQFFSRKFYSNLAKSMANNAGFFPPSEQNFKIFSDLMVTDMLSTDVLGSWRVEEVLLRKYLKKSTKVKLHALEPYLSPNPWSKSLLGRNVLVIHPFSDTIEAQYRNNRKRIFVDPNILPEFASLQTLKAVQTIAGQASEFPDWFCALNHMKSEISKRDFDVAIIGCGAYGFPLAAHVKRLGKKSIHLGGATQLLFGIKGRRWENVPNISSLFNECWVRPTDIDTPVLSKNVEGGCYW